MSLSLKQSTSTTANSNPTDPNVRKMFSNIVGNWNWDEINKAQEEDAKAAKQAQESILTPLEAYTVDPESPKPLRLGSRQICPMELYMMGRRREERARVLRNDVPASSDGLAPHGNFRQSVTLELRQGKVIEDSTDHEKRTVSCYGADVVGLEGRSDRHNKETRYLERRSWTSRKARDNLRSHDSNQEAEVDSLGARAHPREWPCEQKSSELDGTKGGPGKCKLAKPHVDTAGIQAYKKQMELWHITRLGKWKCGEMPKSECEVAESSGDSRKKSQNFCLPFSSRIVSKSCLLSIRGNSAGLASCTLPGPEFKDSEETNVYNNDKSIPSANSTEHALSQAFLQVTPPLPATPKRDFAASTEITLRPLAHNPMRLENILNPDLPPISTLFQHQVPSRLMRRRRLFLRAHGIHPRDPRYMDRKPRSLIKERRKTFDLLTREMKVANANMLSLDAALLACSGCDAPQTKYQTTAINSSQEYGELFSDSG